MYLDTVDHCDTNFLLIHEHELANEKEYIMKKIYTISGYAGASLQFGTRARV